MERATHCWIARFGNRSTGGKISGHRIRDIAQDVADLAADGAHRGDGSNGDQRRNERVLNRRGAFGVFHQATKDRQHRYLQILKIGGTSATWAWELNRDRPAKRRSLRE